MMNVPKLRFKGFSDEWKKKKLAEVANKITDGTHDTPKPVDKGIPFLTAIHIKDGYIDYDNCYYLKEEVHNAIYSRCNPEKGDLLIVNIGAGTAKCAINTVDYEFSLKNVALIKPNVKIINENYLAQYQRNKTEKTFNRLTSGGAQPFLSLREIGLLDIYLPTLPEQEKIASFFTAVDSRLEKLKKKKELLEQYKKGVMQKIFSQDLRFKDEKGNNFTDWEDLILEDLLIEVVEKSKISNQEEVLSSTAKGIFKQSEYFNREIASSDNTGYKILRLNQLVFSPQNLWLGNINVNLKYNVGIVSPSYKIFKFSEKTNAIFCNYFLKLPRMINEYKISSVQGASVVRRNLEMEAFNNIKVKLPCIKEQQKIADFLTALDKKIDLVNQQISKTELWKKGLLQQMFV